MLTEIIVNIKGISFFSNFELVLKILLWYSCIYTLRDHCPHSMYWYKILRTVTNPHGRVSFIGCGSQNFTLHLVKLNGLGKPSIFHPS